MAIKRSVLFSAALSGHLTALLLLVVAQTAIAAQGPCPNTFGGFDIPGNFAPAIPPAPGNPPVAVTGTAVSSSQINVAWQAGDSISLRSLRYYCVYRVPTDQYQFALTPTGLPDGAGFSHTGLQASTTYGYQVKACDQQTNTDGQLKTRCSGYSTITAASAATTFAPDVQPPSVPVNVTAVAAGTGQINVSWSASTDNVGVTSYKIYRNGSLLTQVGNVTSIGNTGLAAGTVYSYTVAACDAAGNCSSQSAAASASAQSALLSSPNALADCLFTWAESNYASLFAPRGAQSATLSPYYYRYYSQTNSYVGVSAADNHVYYLGPASGNAILDAGAAATWYAQAGCR